MGKFVHGMNKTATHNAWKAMIQRCTNPKNSKFEHYGARGITVCDRWLESFAAFLEDMGAKPADHELDRERNEGHYEPGNCRWVTKVVNRRNRRTTVMIEHEGRTVPLGELAERHGIPHDTLWHRIKSGWPVERAVTQPVRGRTA
jgi:hypothetical protein